MVADLHAHYPMHVASELRGETLRRMTAPGRRATGGDRARAWILRQAKRFFSDRTHDSGHRVTVELMRKGDVGVALSVLYTPFAEMDFGLPPGSPPRSSYFDQLCDQLGRVERDVASQPPGQARVAHGPGELDAALAAGEVALVHCVEGGFHLGADTEEIARNVPKLAQAGVAYVTLAHLFFRDVATNANALPFMGDRLYRLLFPQPSEGLTGLGRAAVEAMVAEGILIDVSHMDEPSLRETLDMLEDHPSVPVVASHSAFRFGKQAYNLEPEFVKRIKDRGGVIGLIFAQHQARDGTGMKARDFDESFALLCRHIDRISELTGSRAHVAIGSDLDGFIKPTLGGLDDMSSMGRLREELVGKYKGDGELIASENILRVLRGHWHGAPA